MQRGWERENPVYLEFAILNLYKENSHNSMRHQAWWKSQTERKTLSSLAYKFWNTRLKKKNKIKILNPRWFQMLWNRPGQSSGHIRTVCGVVAIHIRNRLLAIWKNEVKFHKFKQKLSEVYPQKVSCLFCGGVGVQGKRERKSYELLGLVERTLWHCRIPV